MKAETAVIAFDLEGIAVSSGAACSWSKVQPFRALAAKEISPALVRGAATLSCRLEKACKCDIEDAA